MALSMMESALLAVVALGVLILAGCAFATLMYRLFAEIDSLRFEVQQRIIENDKLEARVDQLEGELGMAQQHIDQLAEESDDSESWRAGSDDE